MKILQGEKNNKNLSNFYRKYTGLGIGMLAKMYIKSIENRSHVFLVKILYILLIILLK